MPFEELKTKRLILRKLTPGVLKSIYENYSDDEQMRFLGLKLKDELVLEKEKYKKGLTTFKTSFVNFKLFDKETNVHIGNCGFHTWYVDHLRAEIGYDLVDDSFKQNGLMSEALQAIIPYGFNKMNLHRIEAFVGLENIPSLKLMDKFGFTKEGLLRQHYRKNGTIEDSLVFSLLKSDY